MWDWEPEQPELPPFTVFFPGWMAGRHLEIQAMCQDWGVDRFAYRLVLPGQGGLAVDEIHEYVDGEWV